MISFVQFDTTPYIFSKSQMKFPTLEITTNGKDKNSRLDETSQITKNDEKSIRMLKSRDKEVKNHELAHRTAGGCFASSSTFKYELGPDMRRYAIDGFTPIDLSEDVSPEKTVRKMLIVKKAALAPSKPSNNDRQIAFEADYIRAKANKEIIEEIRNNYKPNSQDINLKGKMIDFKI